MRISNRKLNSWHALHRIPIDERRIAIQNIPTNRTFLILPLLSPYLLPTFSLPAPYLLPMYRQGGNREKVRRRQEQNRQIEQQTISIDKYSETSCKMHQIRFFRVFNENTPKEGVHLLQKVPIFVLRNNVKATT